MQQETGWFCLQDVLSANQPVRALQAGTERSGCKSPGLPVYLHSFTHRRVESWLLFFLSLFLFFSFFFLLFSDQIRATIGLLCQRHSCVSLVSGTGSPCCASAHTWHHLPSLAFIMADEHKLTNISHMSSNRCVKVSPLLFPAYSSFSLFLFVRSLIARRLVAIYRYVKQYFPPTKQHTFSIFVFYFSLQLSNTLSLYYDIFLNLFLHCECFFAPVSSPSSPSYIAALPCVMVLRDQRLVT